MKNKKEMRNEKIQKQMQMHIWPALANYTIHVKDIFYSYSINIELINDLFIHIF